MDEDFYYLVYLSKSKSLMQQDHLIFLLDQSKRNNAARNITGMLLYLESLFLDSFAGRFIQVLEGKKKDVTEVYHIIKNDERHFGLIVLNEGVLKNRYFENWAMGFRCLDEHIVYPDYISPEKIFAHPRELLDANHTLNFLQSFYDMNI
ncbi:BLUF domain-containing protein [Pedobacter gandavensis]|uniref:BLUF domain-containing protein n=1 Tax=Pedobacter TaxID=84567 RepID=UPI001C995DD6|nr:MULTISPECIES: BLUF domain-containing protein [Pedobacter]WGQ10580.1 BLUF domain-containing protein [Pedobacter gandavensis]